MGEKKAVGRENRGKKHGGGDGLQDSRNGKDRQTEKNLERVQGKAGKKSKISGWERGPENAGGPNSILGGIILLLRCFTIGMRELWSSLFVVPIQMSVIKRGAAKLRWAGGAQRPTVTLPPQHLISRQTHTQSQIMITCELFSLLTHRWVKSLILCLLLSLL